jgi:hypothetical protein
VSSRNGASRLRRASDNQQVSVPGLAPGRRDLLWPWAVVALALWALFLTQPRSADPSAVEGALAIGAVAATAGTLLVLSRRNTQNVAQAAAAAAVAAMEAHQASTARTAAPQAAAPAPVAAPAAAPAPVAQPASEPSARPPVQSGASDPSVLRAAPPSPPAADAPPPPQPTPRPDIAAASPSPGSSAAAAAPPASGEAKKGDALRPCPCGFCDTKVDDANGYLTAVTAWVIAVERLCKQASEAMVKGGWVHLPVYEFASDTEALKELLVQTCHEGGGTRAIWTIQGLVTVWEQTLFRVEQEIAATVEPGRYLAWHTATADIRANRHGD